jgi:hypothetical protein
VPDTEPPLLPPCLRMPHALLGRTRRNALILPAGGAALLAAALVWLGPPGTDLAAHVYQRALYVQHGFVLWNNFWYAGRYSFVTYSVLYYPLAAAVGIKLLAVLIVAISVAAFAAVVRHEWGAKSAWSIRVFAVVWAVLVVSAAYPFMLGAALALAALAALQHGRRVVFASCAFATLAASPLAFLLLVVVLVGVAVARRRELASLAAPALAVVAIAAAGVLVQRMFPSHGTFPFSVAEFAAVTAFCLIGIAMTWRVADARLLRWFFVAYLIACIVSFAVASPVGENIARLRYVAAPVAVLTLSLRNWRPRFVCVGIVALASSWNLTPLGVSFARAVEDPAAHQAYWTPAIRYLHTHLAPGFRVEAVDTSGHWPAYFLARADIPLVRGWFRQEDFPQNHILYARPGGRAYVHWLRDLSVRYVVLTSADPDYSARAEARLLRDGRSGLPVVLRTRAVSIFAVPSPEPLVSRPARVLALRYTSIRLAVPRAGTYRLGVNYSPYWQTRDGCVLPTPDGMTKLVVRRPGTVTLRFAFSAKRALQAIEGQQPRTCV